MGTYLSVDELGRKRELHLRIARSRRVIDRRLRSTGDEARQLMSWRTYVARHPGWALMAALAGGMAASTIFRPTRITGWLGRSLVGYAMGGLQQGLWNELTRIITTGREGSGFRVQSSDSADCAATSDQPTTPTPKPEP
jgi:hypothetical protein